MQEKSLQGIEIIFGRPALGQALGHLGHCWVMENERMTQRESPTSAGENGFLGHLGHDFYKV